MLMLMRLIDFYGNVDGDVDVMLMRTVMLMLMVMSTVMRVVMLMLI